MFGANFGGGSLVVEVEVTVEVTVEVEVHDFLGAFPPSRRRTAGWIDTFSGWAFVCYKNNIFIFMRVKM